MGRGNIVGKPMAAMLLQKSRHAGATVTVCHSQTRDIAAHCRRADILIAAIGLPEFVKAEMVRPGAVVIDVGVNRVPDPSAKGGTRLVGDVDFAGVQPIAGRITPNPGGVGSDDRRDAFAKHRPRRRTAAGLSQTSINIRYDYPQEYYLICNARFCAKMSGRRRVAISSSSA